MMNFTRSALGTSRMLAVFTSMETAVVPSFAQLRYHAPALTIIELAAQLNAPQDVATIHPSPFCPFRSCSVGTEVRTEQPLWCFKPTQASRLVPEN